MKPSQTQQKFTSVPQELEDGLSQERKMLKQMMNSARELRRASGMDSPSLGSSGNANSWLQKGIAHKPVPAQGTPTAAGFIVQDERVGSRTIYSSLLP